MTSLPPKLNLNIRQTLRLGRALRLVWQSSHAWTVARVALLCVQGTLPLLSLYLMKLVVDAVTRGVAALDQDATFGPIALLIGLTGAVALASTLCSSLASLVSAAQAQTVTDHVYSLLHAKSIEVDLEHYENSQYYDTFHRAQAEVSFRPVRVLDNLIEFGQSGVSVLAIAGLLLSFHWWVAAILFAATIPNVFVRLSYAHHMYHWKRQRTSIERQAWYLGWMLTRDVYAKEIRLFALGTLFCDRFRTLRSILNREYLALATRRSLQQMGTQGIAILTVFGSFAFIAYQTVHGGFTLGDLVMYYQAFQRGHDALQGMVSSLTGLYENNLFLANLYEFLDLKPTIIDSLHPEPIPRPMQVGIAFHHVSFQYATTSRKALEDITLTIRPGEVVALVGENGSGKTTLIKLLCRLYDPTAGSITIDGIDLRQFAIADLRRQISIIFQDYAKYHLTALENIWFGNIDLSSTEENITEAARCSGADKIIARLPQGYDTILGKWFEDGEELSIGQWQKVALARAFLRNSQVIVLDEPTSAMDPQAEAEVVEKFRQLIHDQAAILISHRLSTIKMADCIYVLEQGRIIESGTHDTLIQHGGTYAHLFETQAQHYK